MQSYTSDIAEVVYYLAYTYFILFMHHGILIKLFSRRFGVRYIYYSFPICLNI